MQKVLSHNDTFDTSNFQVQFEFLWGVICKNKYPPGLFLMFLKCVVWTRMFETRNDNHDILFTKIVAQPLLANL